MSQRYLDLNHQLKLVHDSSAFPNGARDLFFSEEQDQRYTDLTRLVNHLKIFVDQANRNWLISNEINYPPSKEIVRELFGILTEVFAQQDDMLLNLSDEIDADPPKLGDEFYQAAHTLANKISMGEKLSFASKNLAARALGELDAEPAYCGKNVVQLILSASNKPYIKNFARDVFGSSYSQIDWNDLQAALARIEPFEEDEQVEEPPRYVRGAEGEGPVPNRRGSRLGNLLDQISFDNGQIKIASFAKTGELTSVEIPVGNGFAPAQWTCAMLLQESKFINDARSWVGAYGLAQLMPATARGLGVNRLIPQQNVNGGSRYLQEQYNRYRDWDKALAAYNAGPGRVDRLIEMGIWPNGLPRETKNYLRRVKQYYQMLGSDNRLANIFKNSSDESD